jgi:hypothetical protein
MSSAQKVIYTPAARQVAAMLAPNQTCIAPLQKELPGSRLLLLLLLHLECR